MGAEDRLTIFLNPPNWLVFTCLGGIVGGCVWILVERYRLSRVRRRFWMGWALAPALAIGPAVHSIVTMAVVDLPEEDDYFLWEFSAPLYLLVVVVWAVIDTVRHRRQRREAAKEPTNERPGG